MEKALEIQNRSFRFDPPKVFLAAFLAFCVFAAGLIGSFPLQASIITIFLFAGFHNFMEFRYFAARMPVRWGRSKPFYSVGIGGVLILTAVYLAIYFGSGNWLWGATNWELWVSTWNTLFVFWVGSLFYLRGGRKRSADLTLIIAIASIFAAATWLFPTYWSLALVYLHPFIAMWFLERQIRRTKPEWLGAYRICLGTIPVFVVILYFTFGQKADLSTDTNLFWRITQHAGSEILPNISSHFLVAVHVFLETIHYSVWIILIPLIDPRAVPWKLKDVPLFASEKGFPKLFVAAFSVSLLLVFVFWVGFSVDYTATRDIYFAFAIAHVMAEFPFLVKML